MASVTYRLDESVEQALKTSPRVNASAYRVLNADAETGMARGRMLPTVTMSVGRSYVRSISASGQVDSDFIDQHTDTAAVQISQPLFAGMTLLNGYQKARLNEDLSQAEKEIVESQLILDVQTAFLDLIKARGDVRTLRDAVRRLQTSVEAVRAFERVRLAPYVDVLQAEVDLADALQRLSIAENQVAILRIRLNTLLGLPPESPTDYVGNFADLTLDFPWMLPECLDLANAQRSELRVSRKSVAIAEKEAKIVFGGYFPRIDLQGSYVNQDRDFKESGTDLFGGSVDRDFRTDYWTSGITLQWRAFEGGRTRYEHQRARNEIFRLRERLRETADQVSAQVRTAYLTLKEARQRIATASKAVGEAKESQERAQVRFEARVGTIIELLDAQARLTRAETNHSQALADYQQALAQLLFAMGERNAALRF